MKKQKHSSDAKPSTRPEFRTQAKPPLNAPDASDESEPLQGESLALVRELQKHQSALKLQNEEMRRTQIEMEALAERYRDLYDFAPIGYLTLDTDGRIVEANLATATLLGMSRSGLINQRLTTFLAPGSIDAYNSMCTVNDEAGGIQSYELGLLHHDGATRYVQAEVIAANTQRDDEIKKQLRVAILDISARKHAEHTVQEHFEVLSRKLGFLTGELDLERFLRETLVVITEQDHAECAAFWFADIAQEAITLHSINDGCQVLAGAQSGHAYASVPLPLHSLTFWTEMRHTRRPLVLYDFTSCPQFPMFEETTPPKKDRTLLLMPLLLGQNVIGLLVLQSPDRRIYQPEQLAFTQAVAQQVTLAVQMARLGEQARQTAILEERNRLAQEIHDTLAQGFTGVLMQLEVAEDSLGDSPDVAQQHIVRARDLARASLAEARRSVRALRPIELEHDNFAAALAKLITRRSAGTGLEARLDVQGLACPLHDQTETNLLRIAQEALYNTIRHAQAKRVWVELCFEPVNVRLVVGDDGIGFDSTAMIDHNHFGLHVMRERTESLGGVFQLSSRPGHGTQVMVSVPARAPGEWEI